MASNWKERINKIIDAELEKARAKHRDAEGCWRDTGWERYYKAMEKAESEIAELETFRNIKLNLAQAEGRSRRYGKVVGEFRKSMTAYAEDHAGVERPIDETVKALKHRLDQALYEEGLL